VTDKNNVGLIGNWRGEPAPDPLLVLRTARRRRQLLSASRSGCGWLPCGLCAANVSTFGFPRWGRWTAVKPRAERPVGVSGALCGRGRSNWKLFVPYVVALSTRRDSFYSGLVLSELYWLLQNAQNLLFLFFFFLFSPQNASVAICSTVYL